MKIILFIVVVLCTTALTMEKSCAAVIASMPNQAGGKIVLTDEACIYKGQNYNKLYKAYFYTPTGSTGDGCWAIEDGSDTVTVVWHDSGNTNRYPVTSFNIRRK